MKKFTTGMLLGSVAALAGIGYFLQDEKCCRKLMKKGKHVAVKAEEVMDDMIDGIDNMLDKS